MNREIMNSLRNFDKVWQRVSGVEGLETPEACAGDEADILKRFIADADNLEKLYAAAAQRTRGDASRTLANMAADQRRQRGKLQMEYYLLCGDTLLINRRQGRNEGVLSVLRRCYLTEGTVMMASRAAWQKTDRQALSALYREQASVASRHQNALRTLIRRAMN